MQWLCDAISVSVSASVIIYEQRSEQKKAQSNRPGKQNNLMKETPCYEFFLSLSLSLTDACIRGNKEQEQE